ncbi:hypothetical protein AGABI2DRAFT_118261 [Agaricus bisporus var. bisporus H97]|uniref:hypothetical protein n=1 Tax=Agaricus bisporus var. bisporus (strain H97 / ATCC MYA-4626 / FGSC 10389) TaxID=936046 RepID=UPI00029F51B3|nr:hypothetical protein AGABI2DRAFT_118261 [Agaricus bisporus var. bisporus H97]EKV47711.1 hypothetical protein AGABI2DRAFT_118261 [Agaricus bisporus var. bisporus H97]
MPVPFYEDPLSAFHPLWKDKVDWTPMHTKMAILRNFQSRSPSTSFRIRAIGRYVAASSMTGTGPFIELLRANQLDPSMYLLMGTCRTNEVLESGWSCMIDALPQVESLCDIYNNCKESHFTRINEYNHNICLIVPSRLADAVSQIDGWSSIDFSFYDYALLAPNKHVYFAAVLDGFHLVE